MISLKILRRGEPLACDSCGFEHDEMADEGVESPVIQITPSDSEPESLALYIGEPAPSFYCLACASELSRKLEDILRASQPA